MKRALFDMDDFGCGACAYAIERYGRKLPGVKEVHIDLAKREIVVDYDGDDAPVLTGIPELVARIGHDTSLKCTTVLED